MKQLVTTIVICALIISAALFNGCGGNNTSTTPPSNMAAMAQNPMAQSQLPADAQDLCPLTQQEFNAWFAGGTAKENGLVLPANSASFSANSDCSFYRWSERMFLWAMSPLEGSGTVLESSVFYTVEPEVNGHRQFTLHQPGQPIKAMTMLNLRGENGLRIVRDKQGRKFELDTTNKKIHVQPLLGVAAKTEGVQKGANGAVTVLMKGRKITGLKEEFAQFRHPEHVVVRVMVNGAPVFFSKDGKVINVESSQATEDALMSQNGGLVYYIIFANDVYAWFQYAYTSGKIPDTTFPTTIKSRDIVCAQARAHGVTLVDSDALAMEIKTSWVETQYVKDSNECLNITAVVPEYTKMGPDTMWVPSGKERTVRLSMLGMHVVGSTNGHPEMIWATFEYKRNAPADSFDYTDTSGAIKKVNRADTKGWLLCNATDPLLPDTAFNVSHMYVRNDTIRRNSGFTISGSNTLLMYPFGSSQLRPNPAVPSAAASNSQIISLNNNIMKLLPGNDKRKNYTLIGAEWTGGAAPNKMNYPFDSSAGAAVGTSELANTTMETYVQLGFNNSRTAINAGCFNCHKYSLNPSAIPNPPKTDAISHIFYLFDSSKLPPVPVALKK